MVKSGGQWRWLPQDVGPWQTGYGDCNRWSQPTVWQGMMEELNRWERGRQGRHPEPTAGGIDRQRGKAARQPVDEMGLDGNTKGNGRNRHGLTDTLGWILWVVVTPAKVGDREGLKPLLKRWFINGVCRLRNLGVAAGYGGEALRAWGRGLTRTHQIDLEVTDPQGKGFPVVANRWVVERACSWLIGYRRHSKDDAVLTRNSEAMIRISMIAILVRRLT